MRFDLSGVYLLDHLLLGPRFELEIGGVQRLVLDPLNLLIADYGLDGRIGLVNQELVDGLLRHLHLSRGLVVPRHGGVAVATEGARHEAVVLLFGVHSGSHGGL